MGCPELEKLREEAKQVRRKLREKVDRSRSFAAKTDYEPFLKHRLAEAAERIEEHLSRHHCE
jgi:predicted RNase H-like nuclease (RuvC/YqgF family)